MVVDNLKLEDLAGHYHLVLMAIQWAQLVPFLGAGVNLWGRNPKEQEWQRYKNLPSGWELAQYLARKFQYTPKDGKYDLLRVSQYIAAIASPALLYGALHELFNYDYQPTPLHRFFASLPAILRAKNCTSCYQLIVTTNYDDLLERAFHDAREPFELVSYVAEGENRGKFWHCSYVPEESKETEFWSRWPPQTRGQLIVDTNQNPIFSAGLLELKRTVIMKIHGAVDRIDRRNDSYVITEDQYIDYLAQADISKLLPMDLKSKMENSAFLFMGYSLGDWNLRVILRRIWGEQQLQHKSWAIQRNVDADEKKLWEGRNVDIFDVPLEDYIADLENLLQALPVKSVP